MTANRACLHGIHKYVFLLYHKYFCYITSISHFLSSLSSATCLQHTCTENDLMCDVYSVWKGRAVLFGGHCGQQTYCLVKMMFRSHWAVLQGTVLPAGERRTEAPTVPFTLGCAAGYCIACR